MTTTKKGFLEYHLPHAFEELRMSMRSGNIYNVAADANRLFSTPAGFMPASIGWYSGNYNLPESDGKQAGDFIVTAALNLWHDRANRRIDENLFAPLKRIDEDLGTATQEAYWNRFRFQNRQFTAVKEKRPY